MGRDSLYQGLGRRPLEGREDERTREAAMGAVELLTVGEAAEYLRIRPSTLYHWVSDGKITFVKLNGHLVRFREKDLGEFVESQLQKSA